MIPQTAILSIRRVADPDYPPSVPSMDSLDSTLEPDKPDEELSEDELSSDLSSVLGVGPSAIFGRGTR